MKKRLIATLVSLITMIGALISTPAYAADAARVDIQQSECLNGYLTVTVDYVNEGDSDQSLGLKYDDQFIDGPIVIAAHSHLVKSIAIKDWKPSLSVVHSVTPTVGASVQIDSLTPCDGSPTLKFKNLVRPKIVGSAVAGRTVKATKGSWNSSPQDYGYIWSRVVGRKLVAIPKATKPSYKIPSAYKGQRLVVTVRISRGLYWDASASSLPVKIR